MIERVNYKAACPKAFQIRGDDVIIRSDISFNGEYSFTEKIYGKEEIAERSIASLRESTDLTKMFTAEIEEKGDVWAWISSVINEGRAYIVKTGDYIPFNADGCNYTAVACRIENDFIDFTTREFWSEEMAFNTLAVNNGTVDKIPFASSKIYSYLNSEGAYQGGGVFDMLPEGLRAVITEKTGYYPTRYSSNGVISYDSGVVGCSVGKIWLFSEGEVYGKQILGKSVYGEYFDFYPSLEQKPRPFWTLTAGDGTTAFVLANPKCPATLSTASEYHPFTVCFRIGG